MLNVYVTIMGKLKYNGNSNINKSVHAYCLTVQPSGKINNVTLTA